MHSAVLLAALAACARLVAADAALGAIGSLENFVAMDARAIADCPDGHVSDGTGCVDVMADPTNCGFIGHRCARPMWSLPTCVAVACDFECSKGYRRDGAGCELDDTSAVPKVDKGKKPRAEKTFSLCPTGETACPIAAAPGQALSKPAQIELSARLIPTDGYECMDTTRTLESCGGCVSTGEGKACDQIAHARGVGCEDGQCVVFTCDRGFRPSLNQSTCVKTASHGRRKRSHGHGVKRH